VLAGCADSEAQKPAQAQTPQVGVVTLATQPVTLTSSLPGRTTAAVSAEVRPQVGGIVKKVMFEEGANVKAGQLLYQLDDASYQAAYRQAQASLASARASVKSLKAKSERYQALAKIQGVAQQDADDAQASYDEAVAAVSEAQAALASAKVDLDHTRVTAPISGRIGISSVTAGALVTASQDTALTTIRQLDPIYVDVAQSSAQLLRLRQRLAAGSVQAGSRTVGLLLEDGSTYPQSGQLKLLEVSVDESTGAVTLRATFPNPNGTLLPGMYVRAQVEEAVDPQGLLVPQQGITRDAKGQATALVVDANDKVEQRQVTTERAMGADWLIADGLKAGDRLIVEGTNKVSPGAQVQAVAATNIEAPAAAASSTANGQAAKGGTTTVKVASGTATEAR